MRYAVVALLSVVVVSAVALAFRGPAAQQPAAASATPTVSVGPTPTSTASPTSSASSSPAPPESGARVTVTKTSVPAEFRYLVLGTEPDYRLVLLDLDAGRTIDVATIRVSRQTNTPGSPTAAVATSADGRTVLLTFVLPEATDSLFVVRPELGEARLVEAGEFRGAVISSDGHRYAVGRNDELPQLTGLWIGSLTDGTVRRLVSDDARFNGSPPNPYGFSPDNSLIAFGVGAGDSGSTGFVMSVDAAESRVDRGSSGGLRILGADAAMTGPSAGAQFISASELFVWSSRNLFGGDSVTYIYDVAAKRKTELYRPGGDVVLMQAAWRPQAQEYATIERPLCCGVFVAGTGAWLRGRDGSKSSIGEAIFVSDMWWSRNGARLFARLGGDDSVAGIMDLLTGKSVMQFCLRGGAPPAGCV